MMQKPAAIFPPLFGGCQDPEGKEQSDAVRAPERDSAEWVSRNGEGLSAMPTEQSEAA